MRSGWVAAVDDLVEWVVFADVEVDGAGRGGWKDWGG